MSLSVKGGGAVVARYAGIDDSDLEGHLKTFGSRLPLEVEDAARTVGVVKSKVAAGHAIRQLLLHRSETGDAFRHQSGFEAILDTLGSLVEVSRRHQLIEELSQQWRRLLRVTFSVLAAALGNHRGNRMYFNERLAKGGWESLYLKLNSLRPSILDGAQEGYWVLEEEVYGCLFACAIDDETVLELFKTSAAENCAEQTTLGKSHVPPDVQTSPRDTNKEAMIKRDVEKSMGPAAILRNPEALCVAFKLLRSWRDAPQVQGRSRHVSVVQAVLYLGRSSTHNLMAIHRTDLLSILLSSLVDNGSTNEHVNEAHELAALLLSLGITKLVDAHLLYRNADTSSSMAELLLNALKVSHTPSYFHFDLSLRGYSSIELPDLGTQFPPAGPSNGYTLSLWFHISKFDENAHTTLFGAFDSSQTCFVLVYLERDSRNLILQTSVTSSRPSVRFKSILFREGRWYHIAIAHQRPKTTSSSRVSLFVNGSFVEQLKANYPLASPMSKAKVESPEPSLIDSRLNPVQAFVGTPQDLASSLGRDVVSTRWRLASAHLFGDVLSDDLVAVYYELGPRYFGNYQDCLGSFNTYQAAASLKIRNDSLYPGKEQRSDIIRAMEVGGSELLPERKLILGLSPANVLTATIHGNTGRGYVANYVSQIGLKIAKHLSYKGHGSLVINSAIPAVNDALQHSSGHAVLTGDPAVVTVSSLDNAAWQVGGCTAVVLDLLDRANDDDAVIHAINCVLESIRDNWRCSEAVERENGFAILSCLIAEKVMIGAKDNDNSSTDQAIRQKDTGIRAELALKILTIVVKFLGYRADKPEQSVLNNPLAYRVLLVDADFWRSMPLNVQNLYYEQFSVFGVHSKHRAFNAKRLSKMRQCWNRIC